LFTVRFEPIGRRITYEQPLTILEAAQQTGVELLALCGGTGACGRCRVKAQGAALPALSKLEQDLLSDEEKAAGYRLACRTPIADDLEVYVPETSRPRPQRLQITGREEPVEVDPIVRKRFVALEPPTLEDTRADMTRLAEALAQPLDADLNVLSVLGTTLRGAGWKASLALRQQELIHVAGGDSTARAHGVAIDLGSTKLAIYLVDLVRGETIEARGVMNPQIAYGEDIISRIQYAQEQEGGARQLQKIVVAAMNEVIEAICEKNGVRVSDILEITVVGNTAMHHLFLGLPSGQLALSPYVAMLSQPLEVKARELGLGAAPGAYVYCLSPVAGFVGSDHVAMVLASRLDQRKGTVMGIDIGTNTEISLVQEGGVRAVSCASGPAFEGAAICWGMRAAPGAIERVWIDPYSQEVQVATIGGEPPVGICGSGILDAIAAMLDARILDGRGRIQPTARGVRLGSDGRPELVLAETVKGEAITITHRDVERIQLAKGAIRSGIEVLLDAAGITAAEIDAIILAGAFGSFIDPVSAIRIGMLPRVDPMRIEQVGNAAGVGAKEVLISRAQREAAEALARSIEYLELTVYPRYSRFFAYGMRF
jgi:uncharacterized 2Fe-2S/4Fe-4S cluster protein (DUF4445 family)